uniref:Uncharacterized protein n=1 Tax=Biomphalaria glabrata TaxID=6526 RepID=A0A2C9LRQ6_BIOGL
AQLDLQKIRQDGGNSKEQLISEMDKFEKDKLTDLKSILSEYVKIEMMFHARALKYLSECYQAAQRIDTDADMDLFRARLLDVTGLTPNQTMTSIPSLGQSQTPYGFNYALFSTSTSQPTYLPQRPGVQGVSSFLCTSVTFILFFLRVPGSNTACCHLYHLPGFSLG